MKKPAEVNILKTSSNIFSYVSAVVKSFRIKAVHKLDSSRTSFELKRLRENIPYIRNSVIGTFWLTFGVYSFLISVFTFMFLSDGSAANVYVSLCSVLISLPLIFSKGTLGTVFTISKTGKIIAKAIGIRIHLDAAKAPCGRANLAFILGVFFGSATFIFDPLTVIIFGVAIVAAGVVFAFPEASSLIVAVLFPFDDGKLFSLIAVIGMIALAIKIFRGKRSITFHHHRAAVLILLFVMLAAEIFSGSLKFTCMMLIFFVMCAADGYGERAEGTASVAVASCGCIAAVYMAFISISAFGGLEADLSGFNIPAMALMCASLVPLSASFILGKTGLPVQTAFLCSIAMIGFLLYSGYYIYLIASVASIIIFLFFFRRRTAYVFFSLACAVYAVWVWMGGSNRIAVNHIMNFLKELGIAYDLGLLHILVGGRLDSSFGESESFYGAVISKLGIFGVVLLVCIAAMLFGYILREKYGKGSDKSAAIYMRAWAPASSVIVLFICGLGTNIWAYDGIFALFWLLMGASSAIASDAENKAKRAFEQVQGNCDKNKAEIVV